MEFKSEECGTTPEDISGYIGEDVKEWVFTCIEADSEGNDD